MKSIYLSIAAFLILFSGGAFAQCVCANQYPIATLTPTTAWTSIDPCNYAGEYAVINVTAGDIYEFSTCSANGSNVTYDSELTLLTNAQQLLAYNDDFCGTQSYITWTATYTGTVQIHLTAYNLVVAAGCYTNSICSLIRFKRTAGSLTVPANNACAAATTLTPASTCTLTSGTTLGASEDLIPDPTCDLPGVFNDVWYTFNSGSFNTINLTVNLGTAGLVGVEVYTACGTLATGISLGGTLGTCDFNTNMPNPTVLSGLTPNTNYRLRMFTNASYDVPGTFTLCLTTPPPPTVTVNSTTICAGQSATLSASPSTTGGTLLWSNGANTPSITVSPTTTTTYSVTYTNNGTATSSGTVTVNPLPTINAGQDVTICAGSSTTLTATGGSSYSWSNGATTAAAAVSPSSTTTYTVTGTNINGCSNTDQVIVNVNPLPTVTAPANQTLCSGTSTSAVAFSGTAGASYNWTNSTIGIGLGASGSGNIAAFTTTNATGNPITATITVSPSLAGCIGTAQTFTFTVNPTPTPPSSVNVSICENQPGTLTASSLANWYTVPTGGVSIGQALTYTTLPMTVGTYTYYMEGVAGPCISATRTPVTLTVTANPTLTGNTTICPNTTSQMTGSGTAATSSPWTSSNTTVATITSSGLVSALSFGTTTITYTNNLGCSVATTVNVSNPTAPTFNPIAAICSGGIVVLPASSTNNIQGTWSPAVNNTQTTTYTFTPSVGQCATTTQQTVTVNSNPSITGNNSLCIAATSQLTGSGTAASNNAWISSNAGTATVSGTGLITGIAAGTSTITYTNNNGCLATATVTVNATPTLTGNTVICPNTTSQMTGSGTAATSSPWTSSNTAVATISPSGLVSALSFGTAIITYTNNLGCSVTTTVNVSTPTAPTFNTIAAICSGGIVVLPASSTNNIQGTWSPAVNNTQTTTYTFTPSVGQCATSTQQTVTVNSNPSITGNNSLCIAGTSQLTGSGTASSNAWTSSNAGTATVSSSGLITGVAAGTSTITYTNNDGCLATATVTVNASPVANAGLDLTACVGGNVSLTGAATGGNAPYTYTWNNGAQNGVPFVALNGSTYTLTVNDGNGCSGIDQMTLTTNSIDWANLQWPSSGNICLGQNHTIYGQIYVAGVTNGPGQAAGIIAQAGVNATNTDPSTWLPSAWTAASFNTQQGNNDEYMASIGTLLPAGTHYYTYRYSLGAGCPYFYAGFNGGAWNGTSNTNGTLVINNAPNATTTQSACGSYTWHGQNYTQSGTYTQTVPSGAGCDSVLYLNLTINNDAVGPTTQETACDEYTWNGQTYTQSGTYTYNGSTQNGCDSTATLDLTIDASPSNVMVTLTGNTFTASAANATSYSWIDCATNTPIPFQSTSSFTPLVSGSYAVVVSNNCGSDTSGCEPIEVGNLNETDLTFIQVYPNPSHGLFEIVSDQELVLIEVLDLKGSILKTLHPNVNQFSIDLVDEADGVYVLRVSGLDFVNNIRLVKN